MITLRWAKILLAIYASFIVLLVIGADTGRPVAFWGFVGRFSWLDKVGHFLLYGVLAFLVNVVGRCREWRWKRLALLQGSVLVMALVTLEEFSQLLILRRHFDWHDVLADALGIGLFGWLAFRVSWGRAVEAESR